MGVRLGARLLVLYGVCVRFVLVLYSVSVIISISTIISSAEKSKTVLQDSKALRAAMAAGDSTFYSNMFGGKVKIVNGEVVPLERNKEVN